MLLILYVSLYMEGPTVDEHSSVGYPLEIKLLLYYFIIIITDERQQLNNL